MPEILDEEKIQPYETPIVATKKPSVLLSLIAGIAIGAGAGVGGSYTVEQSDLENRMATAKCEQLSEEVVPEKVYLTKIDSVKTDTSIVPEHINPVMARYAPEIKTEENDVWVVSITNKTKDSLLYYGEYTVSSGKTPIFKMNFLDL